MRCARLTAAVVAFALCSTALAGIADDLPQPALASWSVPLYWVAPEKPDKPAPEVDDAEPMTTMGTGPETLPFVGLPPCRIVDTRGNGAPIQGGIFTNGQSRSYTLPGICGIPDVARAVSLNITVTGAPSAPPGAFLLAWPQNGAVPPVSILNYQAGQTVANAAIVPLGAGGGITINVSHSTHVIIDTNGYFGPNIDSLCVNEGQPSSVSSSMITDGTIVNADINAAAAIADTKLATIATAGKVADSALSANVSKLGQSIEAGEITDFERSINLPLSEFFDCESGGGFIDFTSGADNRADFAFTSVNSVQLLFDAVLGQEDQGTRVCTSFPVPLDYVSGGELVVGLVKGSENGGAAERITCTFGFEIGAPVAPGNNTIGSGTFIPDYYGCAPPVLPANMFALRSLRVYVSITTSSGTMNDAIGIRNITFIYTAKQ